jgi:hypothetical protein
LPSGGILAAKERVNMELKRRESRWLELRVRSMVLPMPPSSSMSSGTPDTWLENPSSSVPGIISLNLAADVGRMLGLREIPGLWQLMRKHWDALDIV